MLPRIDQLVDTTIGHELLTFMDSFFGYNQIHMVSEDQEKIAFITDYDLYYYRMIPFGLKDIEVTYQQLVNKVFKNQINRNIEIYMDDILVKSCTSENHVDDLAETFATLCKYHMMLNLVKCTFRLMSGKFLKFMISH